MPGLWVKVSLGKPRECPSSRRTSAPSWKQGQPRIFSAMQVLLLLSQAYPFPPWHIHTWWGQGSAVLLYIHTHPRIIYMGYAIPNIFKCILTHITEKKPWNYLEQQHEGEKQVPLRFPARFCIPLNIAKHQTDTLAQMLQLLNSQWSKLQNLSLSLPGPQFGCSPQKMQLSCTYFTGKATDLEGTDILKGWFHSSYSSCHTLLVKLLS